MLGTLMITHIVRASILFSLEREVFWGVGYLTSKNSKSHPVLISH